jgi:ATP-dependent RNA helicase UAP56/SUB2
MPIATSTAISFVSSEQDQEVLEQVEKRFGVKLPEYPKAGIDVKSYMAE